MLKGNNKSIPRSWPDHKVDHIVNKVTGTYFVRQVCFSDICNPTVNTQIKNSVVLLDLVPL